MELRVLNYFLEVAECGSITAASERLHVTQPTLSRQLKDLETEVGQQLFVRHSHSMSLTQQGAFLRQRAQRIVEMVDQTEQEMNKMGNDSIGDVYIGSAETPHMQELAQAVEAFKSAHPRSVVHFVSGGTDDLAPRFDSGVLDFFVSAPPIAVGKYHSLRMSATEQWMLYTRKDNPLAQLPYIKKEDLLGVSLAVPRQVMRKSAPNNPFADWLGESFCKVDVCTTFNLPFVGGELAKRGVCSVITWEGLLDVGPSSPLTSVPLYPEVRDETYLCWRRSEHLSRAAEEFLACIRNQIEETATVSQ